MTPLAGRLAQRIRASGPITLADFMADCLTHPEHGYYTTRDSVGAAGDFITAPEISQMFGELIGLCLAQAWMDQGCPDSFTLAELGPGKGTLMADVMRATKGVPGFHPAANLYLVEVSPRLKAVQGEALGAHTPQWVDDVTALPDQPLFLVANEYFDALPIRQFRRDAKGWSEKMVGLGDESALTFGWAPPLPLDHLDDRDGDTGEGDIIETCALAARDTGTLATRIAQKGGAALIVDYGDWRSQGDTFQAVRDHKSEDPLSNPGRADLTAHVDFEALAKAATDRGAAHSRLTPQGVFLERLGITDRAKALAQSLDGTALDTHIAAHRRLTHPEEMGTLFKVLGLYPKASPPLPGLEP